MNDAHSSGEAAMRWVANAVTMRGAVAAAFLAVTAATPAIGQAAPSHIRTRWAASVNPTHVLPEYPRPQLVRSAWQNLNGNWDYAITGRDAAVPKKWQGTILVPFAVQSQLSGVERAVSDSQQLWYHRTFATPSLVGGRRLLLHLRRSRLGSARLAQRQAGR